MACTSGCPDPGSHESWGECVRAKNARVMWLGGTGPSFGEQKAFSRTNEAYRDAVRQGLQPQAVSDTAVRAAFESAEKG